MQAYSDPSRADEATSLPDVEVFHIPAGTPFNECPGCNAQDWAEGDPVPDFNEHVADHVGWYWQACFPGCLPDSDLIGPFPTSGEALADAQDWAE